MELANGEGDPKIDMPRIDTYCPSLEKLFGGNVEHQTSVSLNSICEELVVLKAQLKALIGQLALEHKKHKTTGGSGVLPSSDPATNEAKPEYKEENSTHQQSLHHIRIVPGDPGELGTLVVGAGGSGHKLLFKSRPSLQSRQRGPATPSQQQVGVVPPSTFWSFIETSGYFRELGEEDLNWIESSGDVLDAACGGIPPLGSTQLIAASGPPTGLVERLFSCLMDESKDGESSSIVNSNVSVFPLRSGTSSLNGNSIYSHSNIITQRRKKPWEGLCDRILWDLRSLGIFGPIISSGNEDNSNEICAAIRKCQSELATITKKNEERKRRIKDLLLNKNYISALEYYRVLDELDRGIEAAYSRRISTSSNTQTAVTATATLMATLNKKALLMRAFKDASFPRRCEMLHPLGFGKDESIRTPLLQRIAGGSGTPLGKLLSAAPLSNHQDDANATQIKGEKRRKKIINKH